MVGVKRFDRQNPVANGLVDVSRRISARCRCMVDFQIFQDSRLVGCLVSYNFLQGIVVNVDFPARRCPALLISMSLPFHKAIPE